jgi:hypothetical protein
VSGYTLTQPEIFYSYGGASTNLATFTTEDNLMKTYPLCDIPVGYLSSVGKRSSSMKIRASGQVGSTSTPTFTFTLRLLTTTSWSAGGLVLGTSNAITAGSTVTLAPWQLDVDVTLRTLAAAGSATTTVVTIGTISGLGFPTVGCIPAANVTPALATIDASVQYYLFLSCACGTSNSLNLINCQQFKLYLEN